MDKDEVALEEAEKAYAIGEIPIGAVLVCQDEIIARGHNLRETLPSALAHAEIAVIAEGCRKLQKWRLRDCTLYVTVEPCPMCAGAIVNSRIERVVYGADDSKAGAVYSLFNIIQNPNLNHQATVRAGVLEEECAAIMKQFFREQRHIE